MHETPSSFSSIESPTTLVAGWHPVRGWLVAKPGHHFVDVRARLGAREFPGVYGFPRADLADYFKAGRPWLPAEFVIEIEFPAGSAGVQLEALDLAGHWQPLQHVAFTIEATATPATIAAREPITAVEFGRTARLSYLKGAPVIPPWPRMLRVGHAPFQGYLAQPHALTKALYGRLQILGWLFHETQKVCRILASTDLLTLQPLETGGESDGVKARYGHHAHAAHCMFKGMVDVSAALPAPATVRIFAELEDGSMHLVLASRTKPVPTEELKLTWPPFAPLKFWRHWREQRAQVQAIGLPLETGAALRRELLASLREYRAFASPRAPQAAAPAALPAAKPGPLRLLLVTQNLNLEGAPLLFAEYAAYLGRGAGAEVTVLAGQDGPLREHFTRAGATVRTVDPDPAAAASPRDLAVQLARLAATLDWSRIDLVVANTVMSFWGVLLARQAGRPALLYIHESNPPALFFQRTTPALLPAVHEAFRVATAVSFNTPATQAYYATLGSGKNFHLNSAWIDLAAIDAFRAAHPRAALRAKLGLRDDELLVANLGTVCERKGQHDFLRAIEWLARQDPALAARARFLMVGGRDTPYDHELAKDLAALGRANVQVVKETTQAFDYLGAADVFVCTSYEESFPRVVLEAMAFEVPVVSTNVHGIPYMLRDGVDAALVSPGDIAALSAALLKVLRDPATARILAASARGRVGEFDAQVLLPRHARFTAAVAATRA
ncbi:MAG TPA: glycosyltransferase family 4 protein [Lacunisphaera sp.]